MSERENERSESSTLHGVVYYPRLGSEELDSFRDRYDPFAGLISEHLTLVFPVPIRLETLRPHVASICRNREPFGLQIGGLQKSWDHWLSLGLRRGVREVAALHDELYSGPLRSHLREDLPYDPHIGIGFFGTGEYDPLDPEPVDLDAETYEVARREAAGLAIRASRRMDSITIVRLERGLNVLTDVDEIPLGRVGGDEG